ncbi:MAG: bifunctional phosphoribosyl-AMP cyclohydrolase/phosphoribosyl-ATP pyrophosphatase, partial [Butyrivibrio sp.]|nr:bifunctional phosphoribosyl-AMP cyclohydrolase/phosphoribosyl-ATP pyrophosphatase [Butyrivibrio sp.]
MLKQFIPCIYLKDGRAMKSLRGEEVLSEDPLALAEEYDNAGCDALIVFDLSVGDAQHDKAIDTIKKICAALDAPVIGAGGVHRMEDIKKLLYAGCKK